MATEAQRRREETYLGSLCLCGRVPDARLRNYLLWSFHEPRGSWRRESTGSAPPALPISKIKKPPPLKPDRFWTDFGSPPGELLCWLRVIDPRSGARAGKTRPFPDHFQTTRRFRRGAVLPPTGKSANTDANKHSSIGHSAGALPNPMASRN